MRVDIRPTRIESIDVTFWGGLTHRKAKEQLCLVGQLDDIFFHVFLVPETISSFDSEPYTFEQ